MFRRYFGFVLLVACGWTDLNCAVGQATPAANSDAAVTFALWPHGQPSHSPVEVEGLVLDGKALNFDEPLTLPSGWPAHLSVRLRNVSTESITYIRVNLSFPESGAANTPPYAFGYQVHLGNLIPAQALNQRSELVTRQQVVPLTWLPNAEVTIPLLEVATTLAAAERLHQPITRVEVAGIVVQFKDVSTWNGSYFHCQQDGSHCVKASDDEFTRR
jgi:hypothetical protein